MGWKNGDLYHPKRFYLVAVRDEAGATYPLCEQEPLLAQISAASVQGIVATGDRAGRKVRRRLTDPEDGVRSGALCYASWGFSLYAATREEFVPGYQSGPMSYRFEEMPERLGVEAVTGSWA